MCLKISILLCTKSVSTLKYHLKIQKKIYEEKKQKFLHLFDFSLKNKSPEGSIHDAFNVPACFTQQQRAEKSIEKPAGYEN